MPNPHSRLLGSVKIPASWQGTAWALSTNEDEKVRENVYKSYFSGCEANEDVLASMLDTRGQIARMSGFESHADACTKFHVHALVC